MNIVRSYSYRLEEVYIKKVVSSIWLDIFWRKVPVQMCGILLYALLLFMEFKILMYLSRWDFTGISRSQGHIRCTPLPMSVSTVSFHVAFLLLVILFTFFYVTSNSNVAQAL